MITGLARDVDEARSTIGGAVTPVVPFVRHVVSPLVVHPLSSSAATGSTACVAVTEHWLKRLDVMRCGCRDTVTVGVLGSSVSSPGAPRVGTAYGTLSDVDGWPAGCSSSLPTMSHLSSGGTVSSVPMPSYGVIPAVSKIAGVA